jgi:hypothetical protein
LSPRVVSAAHPARRRESTIIRTLFVCAATCFLLAGLLIVVTGGGELHLARVRISAIHAGRPAVIGFVLLLCGSLLAPSKRGAGAWFAASWIGLILSLVSLSNPRRVGDSAEYLAMATSLADGSAPSVPGSVIARVQAFFPGDDGIQLVDPHYRGADGRQDYTHFWLYPLMAAPLVRAAQATGIHPVYGFAALNIALLAIAVAVLWRRVSPAVVLLFAAGPILWWVDKAHTEVFTFSLLTIGAALLSVAPWWSVVACGAAAAQNPPIAVAMLVAAASGFATHGWRDVRTWIALAVGSAVAALHPAYYHVRLGIWSALGGAIDWHWPSARELTAVLTDLNIGILVHSPFFTAAAAGVVVLTLVREPRRLFSIENGAALIISALFLISFSQASNVNSGGTPNPSRYGLWMLPLAIPFFLTAADFGERRWLRALSAASMVWCTVTFAPRLPDNYLTPTRLAGAVWRRWPALDNPLAEIFAERLSGRDPGRPPVATSGCEKVLLLADSSGVRWPEHCAEARVPSLCSQPDALCYANQTRNGYAFARAPTSPSWRRDRVRERKTASARRAGRTSSRLCDSGHKRAVPCTYAET